jgi:hypothetical protein
MLYFLWAIVNIGLFLFFIGICFSATKLLKERYGVLTAIVFVLTLFSFIGRSKVEEPKTWELNATHPANAFVEVDLEETSISKYSLFISYNKDQSLTPISARTLTTGLHAGTTWKPTAITVNSTDRKFEYSVTGVIEWSLLGITLYAQPKHWEGVVKVE